MIMLILITILSVAVVSIVFFTLINGISPMPSSSRARSVVLEEIKKLSRSSNHLIIDVGSGWGTLALQAARHLPSQTIFGVENSVIPLWISRMLKMSGSYSNLKLIRQDIYTYSYAQADIVLCYLYPGAMKRLSTIFDQQLKQDAYIISIFFALPGWTPEKIIECKDMYRTKIYVYRKKI
jgi:hypothetical protein